MEKQAVQNNINTLKNLVSLFYPLNLESWHAELKEKEANGYRFDSRKFKYVFSEKNHGINAIVTAGHH